MAEKDNKPNSTARPAARPATTAKPAATVKPASTAATARPATTAKPTAAANATRTAAKPAEKPATTARPSATAAARPAATATATRTTPKPAEKTTVSARPAASATTRPTSAATTTAARTAAKPAEKTTATARTANAVKPESATAATRTAARPAEKPAASDQKNQRAAMTATKPEKAKTAPKKKAAKSQNNGGGSAAATADNNKRNILISAAISFVIIAALVLGLVFGLRGCQSGTGLKNQSALAINGYPSVTKASFHSETTDNVSRYKPVEGVKDEASAFGVTSGYPTYGSTLKSVIGAEEDKLHAREALIHESTYLAAYGTRGANNDGKANDEDKYTWMDKDGYLFRGSVAEPVRAMEIANYSADGVKTYSGVQRRLYKHTASVGLYLGNVDDNEPGITKRITLSPRGYTSYSLTGVYAPAGEVLTVKLSGAAMTATNGIRINIGQALYNSQANNIWASKNAMNRIPHVLTTLTMDKNTMTYDEETDTWTGYIGSFLGGPVYVQNEASVFTLEISGGVRYSHFVLGYTTPEEFARNAASSAPMFDLEVWEYGVLHSGPKRYAQNFSYDDLYNAAVYWEKVSLVTTQRGNGYKQGVVFIYDPFVAAGAAVAFPGRSSVNCPLGWMSASLNYNGLIASGSWGNMHEYHHNFQGFGVGGGADGEVTNNSLTLVSYALFTNISAKRGVSSFGAAGLGGWNNYTVGTWTLNQINNKAISSTNGLAVYATLLHNFGADAYIKNAKGSNLTYWNNWSNFTGYDMSYYAGLVSTYATGEKPSANPDRPMFIPVSCVYQTGRSYGTGENRKEITTMRPYVIPYGNEFNIDLSLYSAPGGQYKSGSIVLPTQQDAEQTKRFSYKVKEVEQPEHGRIEKIDDLHYKYVPDTNDVSLNSGRIKVTLEITDDTGEIANIDDVDLFLEFQQSHEMNKTTLERTTYTYEADDMYTDAVDAFNAGFEKYSSVVSENQYNPTQNANTDIWFYPDTEASRNDHPNSPDKYFIHENKIEVLDGKLYFAEDGKYRVYLRGRTNCALYFSFNGADYNLGGTIKDIPKGFKSSNFRLTDSNTYFDAEFNEGACTVTAYVGEEKTYEYTFTRDETGQFRNWIYIKEILIDQKTPEISYIGVGTAQWTLSMFSMSETFHNAKGGQLDSSEDEAYSYTQNTYTNYAGAAVAATRTYKDGTVKHYSISKNQYTEITGAQLAEMTESKLIAPTSAAYANAYRRTYRFTKAAFTSDYFYKRNHEANYIDNVELTPADSVALTETNYNASKVPSSWGKFPVTNITDGNKNTYIHTHWKPTESSPLNLTFDIGEEKTANRIIITARNHNNMGEGPGSFKLYGSTDGVAFDEIESYSNLPRSSTTSVNFPETTLRYFKVVITHSQPTAAGATNPYYIVISSVTLTHSTEVTGGKLYSPDNTMFSYSGNWDKATVHSNYGHVFVGQADSTIDFSFKGTRLGIVSSNRLGQNFEVYIDGQKVDSIRLKNDTGTWKYSYVSRPLENGEHSVQIRCTGEANFDSFAIFNEAS